MSIGKVLSMWIGLWASLLSYECSTKHGESTLLKLFYAGLAYVFGLFYILYHFLFKHEC